MKVIFLGTNGWYDTKTGNTICVLVETSSYHVIFDAGYGLAKLDKYVKPGEKPVVLFLSHYHLDHTVGLHVLNKFLFSQGLTIVIPSGTVNYLETIVGEPYTAPLNSLPYDVTILELPGDEEKLQPLKVVAKDLRHVTRCLGYRLEIDGVTVTYLPDTGYCPNAVELALRAELLLAECAYAGTLTSEEWPHLNPLVAAQIAKEAEVKELVLVHFDAFQYPSVSHRKEAEQLAKTVFPATRSARDGLQVAVKKPSRK
ncbi:MAG: ribonuclease Z [Syntrophales bacterium]|nr:ribonuclease Z [Syntrophales bacterium]